MSQFANNRNKPLVLISGGDWGTSFEGADIPLPAGSWIADVHNYPKPSGDPKIPSIPREDLWKEIIGRVPIIFTEMGELDFGGAPGAQSQADIAAIERTYRFLHDYPRGWFSYTQWREKGSQGIMDISGTRLTERGEATLRERTTFPTQTDFTN